MITEVDSESSPTYNCLTFVTVVCLTSCLWQQDCYTFFSVFKGWVGGLLCLRFSVDF